MLTRYDPDGSDNHRNKSTAKKTKRRSASSYEFATVGDGSLLGGVLTVNEVLSAFGLKSAKNVIDACVRGRVLCRKADAEFGVRGGVWLIDQQSAQEIWGK